MRFTVQVLAIIIMGFFMELFMPWWSIAIAAFTGGVLIPTRYNFLAGFAAIGLLWVVKALITDLSSTSDLADRVANLFMLHSKALLMIFTFLLGGLVGGFASMSGGTIREQTPA